MKKLGIISFFMLNLSLNLAESGQYLDPTAKTNVNQVDPLFERSMNNYQEFQRKLESDKNSYIEGIRREGNISELVGSEEARSKANELKNIHENDLDAKGRHEYAKDPELYNFFVDYSKAGMAAHKMDAENIANATGRLMDNLVGKLKELGVDCRTVKGNKEIEPEHHISLEKTLVQNRVYDRFYCEHLRNSYNCFDELSLHCLNFSEEPANVSLSSTNMHYSQSSFTSLIRFNFHADYGGPLQTSKWGGKKKYLGTTRQREVIRHGAYEGSWYVNFHVGNKVQIIKRLEISGLNYGTFIMIKVNNITVFVGPSGGNNLYLNDFILVKGRGGAKYVGTFGNTKVKTYYPKVVTGHREFALGYDNIARSSSAGVINILPYAREGWNSIEVKAISLSHNRVSFSLDVSERICLNWQESWRETCTLNITEP